MTLPVGLSPREVNTAGSTHVPLAPVSTNPLICTALGIGWPKAIKAFLRARLTPIKPLRMGPPGDVICRVKCGKMSYTRGALHRSTNLDTNCTCSIA